MSVVVFKIYSEDICVDLSETNKNFLYKYKWTSRFIGDDILLDDNPFIVRHVMK